MLQRCEIRHNPQDTFFAGHTTGNCRRKTRRRRFVAGRDGKDLVQRAPHDPAFQAGIDVNGSQTRAGMAFRPLQPHPGQRIPEKSQFFRTRIHGPARLEHMQNKIKAELLLDGAFLAIQT